MDGNDFSTLQCFRRLTVPDWNDADAIKEIERRLKAGGDEHGRQ